MLSGVSIICFAASYAVALALELSRPWLHGRVRGMVARGFAGAGLVAHTAFLYYRAVRAAGAPLSSEQDWYLVAAWALVAVHLCLTLLYAKIPFGLFLLPLSLVLIAVATFWANPEPLAREPASRIWGTVHGLSLVLTAVSVLVGFVAGVMYFAQARRLKHKRLPSRDSRLPSLEWLQRVNSRAIVVSALLLSLGVVSGMVLNRINVAENHAALSWHDPVVLSTLLLEVWLVAAVVVGAFYRPVRQGRKVAYLTLVSFVFLAVVLAAGLLLASRHWQRKVSDKGPATAHSNTNVPTAHGPPPPSSGGSAC